MMNNVEMINVSDMNVPSLSVEEILKVITDTYCACLDKGIPFSKPKPIYLWGGMGIGKSQAIQEFADVLRKEKGHSVVVKDIRLSNQSPVEIQGLLMPSEDKSYTEYLPQRTYQFRDNEDIIILFYDEFTSAPPAVQAAAYEIVLDRKIGQNKFPDNVIIIAAGNRTNDKGVTYRMPKPLANRFEHYEVLADIDSWRRWAGKQGIHPLVIEYLTNHPDKLVKKEIGDNDLAFTTPRTWENVSFDMKLLYDTSAEYSFVLQCKIGATIGVAEEQEFREWIKTNVLIPPLADIVKGCCNIYPKRMDVLHSLIKAIVSYVDGKERNGTESIGGKGIPITELENICAYVSRFPADFATVFYRQLLKINGISLKLMKVDRFQFWVKKNGMPK